MRKPKLGAMTLLGISFAAGSIPSSNIAARRRASVDLRAVGTGTDPGGLAKAIQPVGACLQSGGRNTQSVVVESALLLPDIKGRLAPMCKCERKI